MQPQVPPESGDSSLDTEAPADLGALQHASPCSDFIVLKPDQQQKNEAEQPQARRVGRKRKALPSRAAMRMHWLVLQAHENGLNARKLAEITGLSESYLSNWKNIKTSGVKGLEDSQIEILVDKLGLDPRYFFDPYEGPRDYTLYLLDKAREAARHLELEAEMRELRKRLHEEQRARIAAEERFDSLANRVAALEGRPGAGKRPAEVKPLKGR